MAIGSKVPKVQVSFSRVNRRAQKIPEFFRDAQSAEKVITMFKQRIVPYDGPDLGRLAVTLLSNINKTGQTRPGYYSSLARSTVDTANDIGSRVPGLRADYHNQPHTGHVAIFYDYLGRNLPPKLRLLGLQAVMGHDRRHPGGANPDDNIFAYEKESMRFNRMTMAHHGFLGQDAKIVNLMTLVTSPNGGAQYVKEVAKALKADKKPNHDAIVDAIAADWPEEKKRQLDILRPLCSMNERTIKAMVFVHVADIMGSVVAPEHFSKLLTEEYREKYGEDNPKAMDFTAPGATKFFLENIVTREVFELYPETRAFLPAFDRALERANNALLEASAAAEQEAPEVS